MTSMTPQNMDSISRPTSKVLAPPGGRSSNIFGTDPEPIKGSKIVDVKGRVLTYENLWNHKLF